MTSIGARRKGLPVVGAQDEGTIADLAREAIRLADVDPRASAELAARMATAADAVSDLAAGAIAARAQGLAAFHLEDLDAALGHLQRAISLARRARAPVLAAEAQMSKAFVLSVRGRPGAALRAIDDAVAGSRGVEQARALAQRGAIRHQNGSFDLALDDYRVALARLRRADDVRWVARVLQNRGIGRAHRGDPSGALTDLQEAERIYADLGADLSLSIVMHNLGYVHTLRGDIPGALRYFERAEAGMRRVGSDVAPVLRDRSELLLAAGLVAEARDAAEDALQACIDERRHSLVPEVRLLLARAEMINGNPHRAHELAHRAAQELERLGHVELAGVARVMVLLLDMHADAPRVRFAALDAAADQTGGLWPGLVLEARLDAARIALRRGQARPARAQLQTASRARHRTRATIRAGAWQAEGLLRQSRGDSRGARSAARAGLRVLDEYADAIAATDLRAHVASQRVGLAELGLRSAISGNSARLALAWAELGRASHLRRSAREPDAATPESAAIAELRLVSRAIDERADGAVVPPTLLSRQRALERRIRDEHRLLDARTHGHSFGAGDRAPTIAQMAARLGGVCAVEYVALDGVLHAITVADGVVRMRPLASTDDVVALASRLPFALHRMTRHRASATSRRAAADLLTSTARLLDEMMLGPLTEVADRPLVVVPTGTLQWLPWSLLPSCVGRPITVTPSVALWHDTITARPDGGAVVVAAGPTLLGAREEAVAVAAIHGVHPLLDGAATVAGVGRAAESAALIHLAAHGRVRADNPLFGSLRLADGPLMIYDLDRLRRFAHTVVVAACDTGRPAVPAGDELLGLTATLLSRGSAQLVASVLPILDLQTGPLMTALHGGIAAGAELAPALAAAQEAVRADGPEGVATAAGFLCFGAGFSTVPITPSGSVHRDART